MKNEKRKNGEKVHGNFNSVEIWVDIDDIIIFDERFSKDSFKNEQ